MQRFNAQSIICAMIGRNSIDRQRARLLVDVARMYFDQGLTQAEIAERIERSTMQVSRMIFEARQLGIVTIDVRPIRLDALEQKLRDRFSWLNDVMVIPSSSDYVYGQKLLAKEAADYFDKLVGNRSLKVGLAGGTTVYDFVEALQPAERDIKIFPTVIVGRGPTTGTVDPMAVVTNLWAKSGQRPDRAYYATILPIEQGKKPHEVKQEYDRFLNDFPSVKEVYEGMKTVDIVVTSLGPVSPASEYAKQTRRTSFSVKLLERMEITPQWLKEQGIVGDIGYSYFNAAGESNESWKFFLSLGIDLFKEMSRPESKRKVVVIAGRYKEHVLAATLRGQLCNVIVTDDVTAEAVLAEFNSANR